MKSNTFGNRTILVRTPGINRRGRPAGKRVFPSTPARILFGLAVLMFFFGCGSVPSIPNDPEAILAKGDKYFEEEKYFQSAELYMGFTSRYPGHDRSDYAQFRLAESYFKDGDYPLASVEFQILISNYNYSDYVDDALFKIGLCFYHESPNARRDQQKAYDALSRLDQFVLTYPNSPLVEEARKYVKLLHAKLAEKEFYNGHHYFKRKKMRAALIYFDKIIENYKDNEYWARAVYYKGVILQERGETEEAKRLLALCLAFEGELDEKEDARARLELLRQ